MTKAQQIEKFINEQLSLFLTNLNPHPKPSRHRPHEKQCEEQVKSVYDEITELARLRLQSHKFLKEGKTLEEILLNITSIPRYQNDNVLSFLQQIVLQASQKFKGETAPLLINALSKAIDNLNSIPSSGDENKIRLPEELDTPKAHEIWHKAKDGKLVDDKYQPIGELIDMIVLADVIGESLELPPRKRWAPFEKLWDRKNMRQIFSKASYNEIYYEKRKKVLKIIR